MIESGQEPHRPEKILFYMMHHVFLPSFVVNISEEMQKKTEAIQCYESQFGSSPQENQLFDWILNSNRYWGNIIGTEYAEPFISREEIGITDIGALL